MIQAVAFDLDGTLVETELLKAISYARAAQELCAKCLNDDEVLEAYKEMVGRSRQEVAQTLMKRFDLEDLSRKRMQELKVDSPWQAFVQVRLGYFDQMIEDPDLLRKHKRPHVIALIDEVIGMGLRTALTTTSSRQRTLCVLEALDLEQKFDFVATADDVEHTKPDPEIYELVSLEVGFPTDEWLVIEDSLPGVQSALAAGMWCIAVPTPFTRDAIRSNHALDDRWIVEDTAELSAAMHQMLAEREVHV